ncbi:gliding motility protein GldM [Flavobacterium sp.]|uniref:type IX secretion system motor protein PorM/GldM n=1 Tax=Flavobacterium sp. TaxID=239 RepID=UPI00260C7ED6|nr:gliding motility protein GldM [Flavobacterium sp.]
MAGGKLTPRQKMINLMYLVFIAMLALNMSKEVLSAFGLMNEKFESANKASVENNKQLLASIDQKGTDNPTQFGEAKIVSKKISAISKEFFDFVENLKKDATNGIEIDKESGKLPYEAMDKGPHIDETWFAGDNYSAKGTSIVNAINKYVSEMKAAAGSNPKLIPVVKELEQKFNTADVKDREGVKKRYLNYHFEHFPAIASLAKLSAWQNDIQKAEYDSYNNLLGKAALEISSMKNYTALVVLDKNAYFQGEKVTGKVVLGRYDDSTVPTSFNGPGKIENGQAVIDMTAGGVGEQNIKGSFTFMEDNKPVALPFEGKYVVVPRPNSATIAADKMNVVYRGVVNPMTISFAGVSENNVSASAPGLTPAGGKGKYNMSPGNGTEVKINVNAKLPDGKSVTDAKVFRIKNIPNPEGTIGGMAGVVKGQKSRLEASTIGASLPDFDFEVQLNVVQFSMKVTGQPTVVVNGNKLNSQAKAALARTSRGDQVTFSEIKTKLVGSQIELRKTAIVIYEIQ